MTNPEELLDFAVAVAVRLQSCGAETYRVEETVVRIIEAYGIDKSDVFVIPGSIFAGLEDENGQVYSKIRRVKDIDTVLDGVEMYSAFCRRICAETPPVRQARQLCVKPKKHTQIQTADRVSRLLPHCGGFCCVFRRNAA